MLFCETQGSAHSWLYWGCVWVSYSTREKRDLKRDSLSVRMNGCGNAHASRNIYWTEFATAQPLWSYVKTNESRKRQESRMPLYEHRLCGTSLCCHLADLCWSLMAKTHRICEYTFHVVQQLYTHGLENGLDVARKHLKTSTPPRPFRPIMRGPMMRVLSTIDKRRSNTTHKPPSIACTLCYLTFALDIRGKFSANLLRILFGSKSSFVRVVLHVRGLCRCCAPRVSVCGNVIYL